MGIRGLSTWLRLHAADVANLQLLPRGANVLIDGLALAFFLLRQRASPLAPLGSYSELHACAIAFFDFLRAAGLEPSVYLDGRATRLKADTIAKRRKGRADRSEALQAACLEGRRVAPSELPEPLLMTEQLAYSVSEANVRLIRCVGEADEDLARDCAASIQGGTIAYILSGDSDFLIHSDVQYVSFDELSLEEGGGVMARVWSRALLSEVSGLTEQRLIEWAMLLGNDATGGYRPSEFGSRLREVLTGRTKPVVVARDVVLVAAAAVDDQGEEEDEEEEDEEEA